ncbi:helix-turn-helix domain-containing protein [Actinophytocola xanthii]|uniref:Helix-turn-helix domain-containing protein n=1 Tax=Actinophytocola xanthii TaxID=1912961 RepID=A0A1Q8BTW8_9PSEU|nr:hypothetical protein BU204_37045 [Actinophytocola xanthii]
MVIPRVEKGRRLTGKRRRSIGRRLRALYERGASIRALAEGTGRSYGFVRSILAETGVEFRPRGGTASGPERSRSGSESSATSARGAHRTEPEGPGCR